MEIVEKSFALNDAIEDAYQPLNWIDITIWQDRDIGSISFTDVGESEDLFFSKMLSIKEFVKSFGYNAELIKWPADCDFPYHEATININFNGGEL